MYFVLKGAKRVYVYEINKYAFEILEKNVNMNNLENKVIIFNQGVSNEYKNEILYVAKRQYRSSTYLSKRHPIEVAVEKKVIR